MILETEKLYLDLVKMKNGDIYRRFSENDWEILADEIFQDWSKVDGEELEKEYKDFKNKELQEAFLNAP